MASRSTSTTPREEASERRPIARGAGPTWQVASTTEQSGAAFPLRIWPLVPLLLVAAVITWWWPSSRSGWTIARAALTSIVALYAGGVAVAVTNAPDVALFSVGKGPIVTIIGGGVMVVGLGVGLIAPARR